MTPAQCKAARALAGISAVDLATQSGIDSALLREFESELSQPTEQFIEAVPLPSMPSALFSSLATRHRRLAVKD